MDIYDNATWPTGPARVTGVTVQIRAVAKMTTITSLQSTLTFPVLLEVLMPKGTDIRGRFDDPIGVYDQIAIDSYPAPNGFSVYDWYDVGRGFTNEYRVAQIYKIVPWIPPTP
jgi:hypothetical protein